jgi:pimeloyl-ACP methyl ester carboxylesterase
VTRAPLVLLHGFMDTARTWDLVRPALERSYTLLTPTLPGHYGGPPLGEATADAVADVVEQALDDAGITTAHLGGNSLGGYLALKLAERGRARSVVAFAPASDAAPAGLLDAQDAMQAQTKALAGQADAIARTPEGRRRATRLLTERSDHLPPDLVAHLTVGVAACAGARRLTQGAREHGWPLDPARVDVPLRIVWGTEDQLLPWPAAAARCRAWFPHADWVVLDGVGHAPQLDVPAEAAALLDFG